MNNNEVAWVLIKKISAKENRKNILKMIGYSALMLVGSFCTMVLVFEIMVLFWKSSLIEQIAKFIR